MPLDSKRGNLVVRLGRQLIFIIADFLGLNCLFKILNKDKTRVLMYHGVTSYKFKAPCWTQISRRKFGWQMKFLRSRYNVVPASYLIESSKNISNEIKNSVVITFDDGLENNYSEVWPVLKKLNLKAVCFVVPNLSQTARKTWPDELYELFINTSDTEMDLCTFGLDKIDLRCSPEKRFELYSMLVETLKSWPDEKRSQLVNHIFSKNSQPNVDPQSPFKLMTAKQILTLSKSKEFDIGSHSNKHIILSTLSPERQEEEIRSSINTLTRWKVPYIPIFAFPNGRLEDFNSHSIDLLKKMKFEAALTTVDGFWNRTDDNYYIKRISIGADDTKWEFKAKLSGFYYFLQKIVRKLPGA